MVGVTSLRIVVILAALAASACGADPSPPAEPPRTPLGPPAGFRVFATGDTRGRLQPCGCAKGILGGMPRRATYLRAARRPGDLYLDLGNLVAADTPQPRTILEYGLRGLRLLACDAVTPGEAEVRLGTAFEELAKAERADVVCANLRRTQGGERVFAPWRLHALPDGRRVAIVGVTETVDSPGSGWVVDDPAAGVRDALDELGARADSVIVAAAVGEDAGRRLAEGFPGVSLVLAGRAEEGTKSLADRIMAFGEQGQYVARVDVGPDLVAASAKQTWLGEEFADEPDLAALVAACRAAVSATNADLAAKIVGSLRDAGFVGSAQCRSCHEAEHAMWLGSKHARAVHALAAKQATRDPACLPCHLKDVPPDGDEGGLGCEACHGPGGRHVETAATPERVPMARRRLAGTGDAACSGCHDKANSPAFDLATYWPKIAHGKGSGR